MTRDEHLSRMYATAPKPDEHRGCQHRHGAYGECPEIPTFEGDLADCEHGRWNPDNGQCLDCGHMTSASYFPAFDGGETRG